MQQAAHSTEIFLGEAPNYDEARFETASELFSATEPTFEVPVEANFEGPAEAHAEASIEAPGEATAEEHSLENG